ncbi:hypothetical protein SAY87_012959 [Trapa incisa]|uniref:RCC1-like domain-containing protein n=1 Tax=Trapa incisa TaxID=236973 RepID=A0AAN7KG93_9MYRT|nr:hypothetical protein SAY87_012959 [Trapa incisa]
MLRIASLRRSFLGSSGTREWRGMSTKTAVMSFGDGSHGALGLPSSLVGPGIGGEDAYEPTEIPGLPSDVTTVSAGHYHSLAVTSQGQLWAWGRNHEYQLGRGPSSPRDSWNQPKLVHGLDGVTVCSSFASGVISAAIGDDGSLWVWGKSKRGQLGLGSGITEAMVPSRVEALSGEKIAKVSFGWGHALARTEAGRLYGWGYFADGRIGKVGKSPETSFLDGIGKVGKSTSRLSSSSAQEIAEKRVLDGMEKENDMPILWEPCLVEKLQGLKVIDISCGLDHSLVLCGNGTLLSCGSNIYGQLGRKNQDLGLLPVDLNSYPTFIASGLGHSLAICSRGSSDDTQEDQRDIFSWGWNQSSQLGRTGQESVPSIVPLPEEETAVSVSGGRVHSLALTAKGEVWVWGCGRNGRLGLGSSNNEIEPIPIESLEGVKVLQAVSGFDHGLLLVSK